MFIIFIAFVCCWSPYIVVLLYDNSDSLPLPVHVYSSMLAHLHASLNFAIYGLSNRAHYQRQISRLVACCFRRAAPASTASNVLHFASDIRRTSGERGNIREADVNRALVDVECHQSLEIVMCHDAAVKTPNVRRPPVSFSTEEEHFVVTP